MDRLIQLQQRKGRPKTYAIAENVEEEEEDVADFYEYVPRRKGDFPPVAYEPPDSPPQTTRYEILDRVFEDDIPIYIVRPRMSAEAHDILPSIETDESSRSASQFVSSIKDGVDNGTNVKHGSRSISTPASTPSLPGVSDLNYDPDDPAIERVDLFDIYEYVTQRELERFETYRFEHPKPEDYPEMIPASRSSSVVEREERAQHRQDVKKLPVAKPKGKRGRPPKKQIKVGPMVVIDSPRSASGTLGLATSRDGSEEMRDASPDGSGREDEIVPTIEEATEELDLLDMSTSLRGTGGMLGKRLRPSSAVVMSRSARSSRSISRLGTAGQIEAQRRQAATKAPNGKRRGRPPKKSESHSIAPSAQPSSSRASLSRQQDTEDAEPNDVASALISRLKSKPSSSTQSTLNAYFKVKETIKLATRPPSSKQSRQSPRKETPGVHRWKQEQVVMPGEKQASRSNAGHYSNADIRKPVLSQKEQMTGKYRSTSVKTNGKQPVSKSQSVQPMLQVPPPKVLAEDVEMEDGDDEENDYEISHIVLHEDSGGQRYYLVAWKGYDLDQATYLTAAELESAPEILQEYLNGL